MSLKRRLINIVNYKSLKRIYKLQIKQMQNKKKLDPVICGIDIGSWTVKIACYDGTNFDILTNQANFRETPSLVAFTPSQRMIGQPANTKLKTNFTNTIRAPTRLIGLGKNPHLIQQQLRYSTVNYELQQSIAFMVKQSAKQVKMQPQQLVMALMSKVKQIVSHHNYTIYASYIAVPSYLSNSERLSIRKCAQVIKLGQIHLVDDWVAIASEYSYYRLKQLQSLEGKQRDVIFVDVGYSKFSIYAVRFTHDKCQLLDYQHLKHTGAKNMDNYLTEFYDDLFYKQTGKHKLVTNSKALIKLKDMIEKQRKVLSANTEHHLNIEYLVNQDDLAYNMKREEFENIIMPVLSQMAAALSNIKVRVEPKVELCFGQNTNLSVEMIGGASRIPLVQKLVSNIFGIQTSKTLNSSQAMARGASIYGAIDVGFVTVPYQIHTENFTAVSVVWNSVKNDNYLGENAKHYPNKKIIFDFGCKYPCQSVINFGPEGVVELYVHYEHEITSQSIGYIRVNTPNKVVFILDKDKIISAKCLVGGFICYNFHQIKEEKWMKMQKVQKEMQQNDKRIITLYNMKNEYESLIYKVKDKLQNQWKGFSSKQEKININEMLEEGQSWVETENQKPVHSDNDVKQYTERIDILTNITQMMKSRQLNFQNTDPQYRKFITQAKSKNLQNPQSRRELQRIVGQVENAYRKMQLNLFESSELTVDHLREAARKISRL